MEVIKFKGCNVVFAENQPEYLPLPAHRSNTSDGVVTSCWKFSFMERLKILIGGKLFLQIMTFNQPLQPLKMVLDNPVGLVDNDGSDRPPGPSNYPRPVNDNPVG